ncbi:ABC-type Fe3+ transport system permease subunit [Rhizobium sp. BK538]|nr:ABC-type Fe3+ transport system permease subunit [Rhizobium sp. BK060]MBB4171377.1 ABC-type Fe3+ transport system permease subunit [Rhizobium sp. BK538]
MRKILVNCTVAAMALCSLVLPSMADSVTVTRQRSFANDYDQARPAIPSTITASELAPFASVTATIAIAATPRRSER